MSIKRKEIVIEIKRIKVLKERPATKQPAVETKEKQIIGLRDANTLIKRSAHPVEQLFDRFFLRRV